MEQFKDSSDPVKVAADFKKEVVSSILTAIFLTIGMAYKDLFLALSGLAIDRYATYDNKWLKMLLSAVILTIIGLIFVYLLKYRPNHGASNSDLVCFVPPLRPDVGTQITCSF